MDDGNGILCKFLEGVLAGDMVSDLKDQSCLALLVIAWHDESLGHQDVLELLDVDLARSHFNMPFLKIKGGVSVTSKHPC